MRKQNIKIRCSSIGKIMTNSRGKAPGLSQTTKSYLKELWLERELGIKNDFWSRYTDKGILLEKDSITLANNVLNWGLSFLEINEGEQKYWENEYITGHTDVENGQILADVKTSWDATTFPFFDEHPPNKNYIYQLHGYMALTGHSKAFLSYCLVNTPEDMVLDEIRREHWKQNSVWNGDEDEEIVEYVRSKHNFTRFPEAMRVKNFIIERDENIIKNIYERVEACREYYHTLDQLIDTSLYANQK